MTAMLMSRHTAPWQAQWHTQRSAIVSSATPLGDEHRAHDSQSGEFPGHYATSFLALDNCLR
jgi:hypothetical protein